MTKIQELQDLDNVFEALANVHRREIIYVLSVRVQDIVNTFGHESYRVEGSGHRELYRAVERWVNSGLSRATVSEMS